MSRPSPPRPAASDPLAETLHRLQLTGTLYCSAELTAPWGIDIPPIDGCAAFQIITAGRCWFQARGTPSRWLPTGSLTFLPRGTAHREMSAPGATCVPLDDLPVEAITDRYERLSFGGDGACTRVLYGVVQFDDGAAHRLLSLLPTVVHLDTGQADGWLHSTAQWAAREASQPRPGGETVITRLADLLIIQAIRVWLQSAPEASDGWLGALRDERVGPALAAIHRDPAEPWTVASLANVAGMSRSAFSAKFSQLVGQSAMQYLTEWRMQLARAQLRTTSDPVGAIAMECGYASEAAFCKAFKRTYGVSPGRARNDGPAGSPPTDAT